MGQFGLVVLTLLATAIGIFSLRYALPRVPLPSSLPNFLVRHGWVLTHAIASSVALLIGPWQFVPLVRRRWLVAHRWLGRLYCVCVAVGWIASVPLAAHAAFGWIAASGFLLLGAAWIGCTTMGYVTVRRGEIQAHRPWMIRSYALSAAAITLRVYLPALMAVGVSFAVSYRIVAWACWVFNLLFAEWLIRRNSLAASAR